MKSTALTLILAFLILPAACLANNDGVKASVVKVFTILNAPDYKQPWQTSGQQDISGSGVIIEGNRVLTNAHVVSNATYIQLLRFGETQKYPAEVIAIDHDCDLAMLIVKDPEFFRNSAPVAIGGIPAIGDKVSVLGFPVGGEKLSVTEGIVSRIEVGRYAHTGSNMMLIQIDAAINPGNSGGPVIRNNSLAGIAFESLQRADNIGYIIPTAIIKHFLLDAADGKYAGFPRLGISFQKLENAVHRQKLGLAKNQTGIMVTGVEYDASAWGCLKEGDVILSIDNRNIANDGTVAFVKQERLDFGYILNTKHTGDMLKLKIIRDKKLLAVNVKLKRIEKMVPFKEYDKKPTYFIFGGFVFTNLAGNHLESMDYSDDEGSMYSLWDVFANSVRTPEKQGIVLMEFVLPDALNDGYHGYKSKMVEKINGRDIRDIKDFITQIEAINDGYIELTLVDGKIIVMDAAKSRQANKVILEKYNIPSDRSADLQTTAAAITVTTKVK